MQNYIEQSIVYATAELEINSSHQGAVFVCTMTSSGFPDRQRSCQVGPVKVISTFAGEIDTIRLHETDKDKETLGNDIVAEVPLNDCSKTCYNENTDLQYFLTISIFTAGLLMVIFLTTTIIMCCKYQHLNGMISDGQPGMVSCNQDTDHADPVYVSLQRRSNYERVYMPFEEPNITENKVVLPKEVFDEFYKSLRMKGVQS